MNPVTLSRNQRVRLSVSLSVIYLMLLTPLTPLAAVRSGIKTSGSRIKISSDRQATQREESVPAAVPAPVVLPMAGPVITATKQDSFLDPDGDGKAEPGQTINYTVTVSNTGTSDATGVVFTDTPDANTTLVGGSITATPVAIDDTYNATGNIRIHHNAPGLLTNDRNPVSGDSTGLTASGGTTSTQNGTIVINSDGSFDYTSAPGFTGTDTFNYTVTDSNGKTDTAKATITVSNTIWFIQAGAAPGGNGTLAKPFNTIAAYNASSASKDPGDVIFLYSGTYSGNLSLNTSMKLIGQAVDLASNLGFSVASNSDPLPGVSSAPIVSSTSGSTVTVLLNNAIRGLVLRDSGTADISGSTFGTLTTSALVLDGAGPSLNLLNGTLSADINSISQSSGAAGAVLTSVGGTLNVPGGINITTTGAPGLSVTTSTFGGSIGASGFARSGAAGPAVSFSGSTGMITFASLGITNSAGTALLIANSSNLTTSNAGSLSATTGPALDVTAGAVLNLKFAITNSTGSPTNGVNLTNATGTVTLGTGSIGTSTGTAFNISGGGPNVTYGGTITQSTSNQYAVTISGTAAGTSADLSGVIPGNNLGTGVITGNNLGKGVSITSANGGVTFNTLNLGSSASRMTQQGVTINGGSGTYKLGTVNIYTSGAIGIKSTDSSATVNFGGGTVDSSNATAVSVVNAALTTTLGGSLATVNSSGTVGNGISLVRTAGSFTVNGGTIANKTGGNTSTTDGTGIYLDTVTNITLNSLQLHDFQNYGIKGSKVSGFTMSNVTINGINGDSAAGGSEEGSIRFDNLSGTASITNSSISGGFVNGIRVQNTTGTLTRLTLDNVTVNKNDTNFGDDAVHFEALNNGTTMNLTVQNSFLTGARADLLDTVANNDSTMDVVLRSNKFSNNHTNILSGGGGVIIQGSSTGNTPTVTYDVSCNRFRDAKGIALNIFKGNGGGTFTGTIANNAIGVSGVTGSGSAQSDGIRVIGNGSGTHTVLISGNTIRRYNEAGITLRANDGSSVLNATVFGNITSEPEAFAFAGLYADIGADVSDTNTLNLVAGSFFTSGQKNDFSLGDPANFSDVNLNTAFGGKINLSKNGSPSSVVATVIKDDNLNPATTDVFVNASGGAIVAVNTLPSTPPPVASCSTVATVATPVNATLASTEPIKTSQPEVASTDNHAGGSNAVKTSALTARLAEMVPAKQAASQTAFTAKPTAFRTEKQGNTVRNTRALSPVYAPMVAAPVSINIGTLPAGKSVTITFQVTVNNPFGGAQLQVANQGTVSGSNFSNVLTDDPDTAAPGDPTVTPIAVPQLSIKDASVVEPASGTKSMIFTVALNAPASSSLSVNFATADQAPGAGHAVADVDYTPTSGIISFSAGEMIKTIAVPVLSDAVAEGDETFLVNLSTPTNATIIDGQAIGTIKATRTPSIALISELRTSGPGGPGDDFVEIYNNTDNDITVASSDGSAGWSVVTIGNGCGATPVIVATINNGTVIPKRGHYLLTGSQYSLGSYATGDQALSTDIGDDSNVALFNTASVANLSTETRLDAVGFGGNVGNVCDLLREGTNQPAALGSNAEHSYLRKLDLVVPLDTDENSTDLIVVSTTPSLPVGSTVTPIVGAPGPENRTSPTAINTFLTPGLVEPTLSPTVSPNRTRSTPSLTFTDPNTGLTTTFPFGTLAVRRTYTNNTAVPVTRLRFRIVDITAGDGPAGNADVRAITSIPETAVTSLGSFTIQGTVLEQAPNQQDGGGFNSTPSCCTTGSGVPGERTVTLATPLMPGQRIALQWLLGLKQKGNFRFYVSIEGLMQPAL